MAKWQNGKMAKWQNGKMAKGQNGEETIKTMKDLAQLMMSQDTGELFVLEGTRIETEKC